jgi:hypothetical protein
MALREGLISDIELTYQCLGIQGDYNVGIKNPNNNKTFINYLGTYFSIMSS